MKSLLVSIVLVVLTGCEAGRASFPATKSNTVTYAYRITQYYGANDLAIRSKTYFSNEISFGAGHVSFTPGPGKQSRIVLYGTIEVEEGEFVVNVQH